jgi:hypothetical protein
MTDECKWSYTKDGKHREFILPGPFTQAAGKKVCQDCLKWLGYHEPVAKETSPVSEDDRSSLHLLQAGKLPDWEAKFINDVAKRHEFTEKQRTIFNRIKDEYLKTAKKQETTAYDIPDDAFDLF